jgi:hypothetical protein
MVNAHRYLATLHRDNGGDSKKAAFHQQEAARIIRSRPRARTAKTDRTEKLFEPPGNLQARRAVEDSFCANDPIPSQTRRDQERLSSSLLGFRVSEPP